MKKLNLCMLLGVIAISSSAMATELKSVDELNEAMIDRWSIEEEVEREYLGEFTITHYCLCEICNYPYIHTIGANGEELIVDYSIAVDPKVIPLNSIVEIEGYEGHRKAMDTGGRIKGNKIDVCVSNHELAMELGIKKNIKVYKIKE